MPDDTTKPPKDSEGHDYVPMFAPQYGQVYVDPFLAEMKQRDPSFTVGVTGMRLANGQPIPPPTKEEVERIRQWAKGYLEAQMQETLRTLEPDTVTVYHGTRYEYEIGNAVVDGKPGHVYRLPGGKWEFLEPFGGERWAATFYGTPFPPNPISDGDTLS